MHLPPGLHQCEISNRRTSWGALEILKRLKIEDSMEKGLEAQVVVATGGKLLTTTSLVGSCPGPSLRTLRDGSGGRRPAGPGLRADLTLAIFDPKRRSLVFML